MCLIYEVCGVLVVLFVFACGVVAHFRCVFSVFPGRQNNAETRDCYVPHKMKYLVKIAEIMKFAFKGSKKNNHSNRDLNLLYFDTGVYLARPVSCDNIISDKKSWGDLP